MHESPESLIYDFIIDNELATDAEITLVTNINGWNIETLNAIIWCRSEYHDAEQCYQCEPDNFYMSEELKDYYGLNEEEEEEEEEIPEDYPDPDYDLECESNRAETEYFNY